MEISTAGIALIKLFEGFKDKSYQDQAGVWTIGFGSTMWSNGLRVKLGQSIDLIDAEKLLKWEVRNKTVGLNSLVHKLDLTQNQFDALGSFVYNLGIGSLSGSTLIQKIRINPADPLIKSEFIRWNKIKVKGKYIISKGLNDRREKESTYYFS